MPAPTDPTNPPSQRIELEARGALPHTMSGRWIGIGPDGVVHAVHVHGGRVTYAARQVHPGSVIRGLVAFEGSILAFGDDASIHELGIDAVAARRVDLAGHGRVLAACPRYDPASGELHLVARDADGAQAHVVIGAGALTRRTRAIVGSPGRVRGLALGRGHAVFVADGAVGVASRVEDSRPTWIPTGTIALEPIRACSAGDGAVLFALTPALERWTLHPDHPAVERDIVDAAARRYGHSMGSTPDEALRYVWTTGDGTISRHDIVEPRSAHVDLTPQIPGDFVLVPDASRPAGVQRGWFVGAVHDAAADSTHLRVIDATDPAVLTGATIQLPGRIPTGLRCEWLPSNVP